MSTDAKESSFMETGLDWTVEDRFTTEERDALLDWYSNVHGTGDLSLVAFAPFLIEHMPGAFKRTRRHVQATLEPQEGVTLPVIAHLLFNIHSFAAIAFSQGVLYEIIAARHEGASKALVLDVLGYAYLSAGPRGMNAVAELSDDYLRGWPDSEPPPKSIEWPNGWSPDQSLFQAGIDYSTPGLSSEELLAVCRWHERMHGMVPRHVELFGHLHPQAFKLQRIRYETSIGNVMPAQLAPLMTLQLATLRLQPALMRQAMLQARALGVRRHHALQTVLAGLRQMMADMMVLEVAAEAVGDILMGWDE
jgi:hypothetical protein